MAERHAYKAQPPLVTLPLVGSLWGGLVLAAIAWRVCKSSPETLPERLLCFALPLCCVWIVGVLSRAIVRRWRAREICALTATSLEFLCRRYDRGWLSWYRRRIFGTDQVSRIEIGRRADMPVTSLSTSFGDIYMVVTADVQGKTTRFGYSPLQFVSGWHRLVDELQAHPSFGSTVMVGPLGPYAAQKTEWVKGQARRLLGWKKSETRPR
jgi:hypothetical protein